MTNSVFTTRCKVREASQTYKKKVVGFLNKVLWSDKKIYQNDERMNSGEKKKQHITQITISSVMSKPSDLLWLGHSASKSITLAFIDDSPGNAKCLKTYRTIFH